MSGVRLLLVGCVLLMVGCASRPYHFQMHNTAEEQLWPELGEMPRYRYIGELHGESRTTRSRNWLGWLVGLVRGSPKPLLLKRPYSGYTDEEGRIYVTDIGAAAVFVFDPINETMTVWGEATARAAFLAPTGIAAGPRGEIWVSDADLGQIFRFTPAGEPLGQVGRGVLRRPLGLAFDPEAELMYVADVGAHAIMVIDAAGHLVDQIGGRGEAESLFNFPNDVAFRDGRLFVSDTMNARVQVMDGTGSVQHTFGHRGLNIGNTPRPKGVAVDGDGNVYAVESYFGYLLVYNAHGQFLLPLSGKNRVIGEFYLPAGVWVDRQDRVYLADMFNGRIVVLQYLGGD